MPFMRISVNYLIYIHNTIIVSPRYFLIELHILNKALLSALLSLDYIYNKNVPLSRNVKTVTHFRHHLYDIHIIKLTCEILVMKDCI